MEGTTVRDSTINIPIKVDEEVAKDFLTALVQESKTTKQQNEHIILYLREIRDLLKKRK